MKKILLLLLPMMLFTMVGCVQNAPTKPKTYGKAELKKEMEMAVKEMNSVIRECK